MDNDFLNWFAGFVDGEGCFSIEISKHPGYKLGYGARPHFVIALTESDFSVLNLIQEKLNSGCLRTQSNRAARKHNIFGKPLTRFYITKQEECLELYKLLNGKLRSKKKHDFIKWGIILNAIKNKEHSTKEGLLLIAEIRDTMNIRGKSNKKYRDLNTLKSLLN